METIVAVLFLIILIIIMYIILFYVAKQFSSVLVEYDNSDKQEKQGIIAGFVLFSCFIIAPSYGIMSFVLKIFELFYK